MITDAQIHTLCHIGRSERWTGDGAAYDLATVRKVVDFMAERGMLYDRDGAAVAIDREARAIGADRTGTPAEVLARVLGEYQRKGAASVSPCGIDPLLPHIPEGSELLKRLSEGAAGHGMSLSGYVSMLYDGQAKETRKAEALRKVIREELGRVKPRGWQGGPR